MNPISTVSYDNNKSVNKENGFNNDVHYDPSNNFIYDNTAAEKVLTGQNNTYIVFGRDRPGTIESGYGGKGHEKCGALDLVVGRLSRIDATTLEKKPINSNISADAARIYLSQKADIDDYHYLAAGRSGKAIANSAIAMKADDVRIIARNSLKLVTRPDSFLSNGNPAISLTGVELIANNDDSDMQPIPKGTNLVNALNLLTDKVFELNGIVENLMQTQKTFNQALTTHTHFSPFNGIPTSVSPQTITAGKAAELQMLLKVETPLKYHTNNLVSFRTKFLFASSKTYINSSYHSLN